MENGKQSFTKDHKIPEKYLLVKRRPRNLSKAAKAFHMSRGYAKESERKLVHNGSFVGHC